MADWQRMQYDAVPGDTPITHEFCFKNYIGSHIGQIKYKNQRNIKIRHVGFEKISTKWRQ